MSELDFGIRINPAAMSRSFGEDRIVIGPRPMGRDMAAGTLRAILDHAGMIVEECVQWLT